MITTYIMIAVVLVLVVTGAILGPVLARRRRKVEFQHTFGAEYSRAVETAGSETKAEEELEGRRKHVENLIHRRLSADESQRNQAEWDAVLAKFLVQRGRAAVGADQG